MANKKVLITGATGFVGSHLVEYILENHPDYEIHGTKRWHSQRNETAYEYPQVVYHMMELRNINNVFEVVNTIKPVKIFHLAAQSFVPTSWQAPAETLESNIIGEVNLFEAVVKTKGDPVIQIAGSSEEYGEVLPDETPITEKNPLRPLSPYAVSKIGQDFLAYQYFKSYGLKVVRTRAFNHTGPRRGSQFVTSNFARQIALIEAGRQTPVIMVGNLDSVRDFTDVRDIVRAYWLATEKCQPGEIYNIASGKGIKIRDMLEILLNLSKVKIETKQDPARLRPSDVGVLIGDASKFKKATGWLIEIPFEKTLEDLLNYWREQIQ